MTRKITIVGGGPGGYIAAIRAAQLEQIRSHRRHRDSYRRNVDLISPQVISHK